MDAEQQEISSMFDCVALSAGLHQHTLFEWGVCVCVCVCVCHATFTIVFYKLVHCRVQITSCSVNLGRENLYRRGERKSGASLITFSFKTINTSWF